MPVTGDALQQVHRPPHLFAYSWLASGIPGDAAFADEPSLNRAAVTVKQLDRRTALFDRTPAAVQGYREIATLVRILIRETGNDV
jgi:hypothetical protein